MLRNRRVKMAKNSSDSTIKFLIYILLFLIFILLMLLLFIIPSIKSYKAKKSDLGTYTAQNKHLSTQQVSLNQEIKAYKNDNASLLKSFSDDFNKTAFTTFASKYFTNVSLVEGKVKHTRSQFKEYTFKATSSSSTPVDFYKFIDALESYPAIIKINFPIRLVSKDKNIELDFNMSIYHQNN